jgi:hypothetical protein
MLNSSWKIKLNYRLLKQEAWSNLTQKSKVIYSLYQTRKTGNNERTTFRSMFFESARLKLSG